MNRYKIYIRIETPNVKIANEFKRTDFEDAETWIRTARRWIGDLPEDKGEDEE